MNDELRPCPFCGAPAQQNGYAGGSFGPGALYGCSNKACEAYGAAVSLSLATWNQRPIEDALRAFKAGVPWEELYYAHDALQSERQRKHDMHPHGQLVIDYAPALNKFINDNDTLVRAAIIANAPKPEAAE